MKAVERWHEQILQAVLRHIDFNKIKCVILAGPGFTKVPSLSSFLPPFLRRSSRITLLPAVLLPPTPRPRSSLAITISLSLPSADLTLTLAAVSCPPLPAYASLSSGAQDAFWDWMCREANKRDLRDLILSKPKWVLAHASSAHKHSLKEVLAESAVSARVADTKAVSEVLALKSFFDMMAVDPLRVTYGYRYVSQQVIKQSGKLSGNQVCIFSSMQMIFFAQLTDCILTGTTAIN